MTRLWLEADVRALITVAADAIDEKLRGNPRGSGESRDGDRRILFIGRWR